MMATIYRKSAVWGQSGRLTTLTDSTLKMLFYNGYAHAWFCSGADMKATGDMYYLMMLPWFKLHARNVEAFRREDDRTVIDLEVDSSIAIDWSKQTYAATADGVEITRDSATFWSLDDNRIAFFAATERELTAPLLREWKADSLVAFALTTQDRREVRVTVKNGSIVVLVKAQEPVIVYREADNVLQRPS